MKKQNISKTSSKVILLFSLTLSLVVANFIFSNGAIAEESSVNTNNMAGVYGAGGTRIILRNLIDDNSFPKTNSVTLDSNGLPIAINGSKKFAGQKVEFFLIESTESESDDYKEYISHIQGKDNNGNYDGWFYGLRIFLGSSGKPNRIFVIKE